MPDIRTRLGRYCAIHKYAHEDEYLVCDFCNEHKWSVYNHDRYYNYGFSKCVTMPAMTIGRRVCSFIKTTITILSSAAHLVLEFKASRVQLATRSINNIVLRI
jgi:hypothetical protein